MTADLKALADNLEAFNRWRRGEGAEQPDPKAVGQWVDQAVAFLRAAALPSVRAIESAPRDGRSVLVAHDGQWVAAVWLRAPGLWEGWAFEDEIMRDALPQGPSPAVWLDAPQAVDALIM
ncbi:hypothetical protein [Ideonella livida]|uniref:Uncharacterized protein n=1 Tax=Ideonella livida TaxID=2707176 RepID=A0A7C9TGH2_9BURK|nr:hypothetical protein [Ideonella livida]NDY89739.1 hypothetical protein [Ideonella livida]